jgi:hypothetical protein
MSDGGTGDLRDGTATEIVVSVGDSPDAAAALRGAAERSRRTGVPLRIVQAWQITAAPLGVVSAAFFLASAADARARATRWVLDTLGGTAATVRWVLVLAPSPLISSHPGGSG